MRGAFAHVPMRLLLDAEVDGIITDEIETLRDIMKARGLWATAST